MNIKKNMATRKRKTTTMTNKSTTKPVKRRRTTPVRRKTSGKSGSFFVPLFLMFGILFCLGFLLFMGYRTVTASSFFDVKAIEINGVSRASKDEIERIVLTQTEKSGAWNADLKVIKADIEKLTLVKSAVVSRILPDGIRVNVIERNKQAIVQTGNGDFWVDEDAAVLGAVAKDDQRPPFVLRGWDASESDKAIKENQERVRVYLKMLNDWKQFELSKRVTVVDLSDLREPQAIVQDSGELVTIVMAKDNFSKLKTGLEDIAGRGCKVESIDVSSAQSRLTYRKNASCQN
jgi:cell division septal protein FtsQ